MSYSNRVYRQRNAHVYDNDANKEQSSFFSKSGDQAASKGSKSSFFQAKLAVGQPNDAYEKEADEVAGAVVNDRRGNAPVIQQKKISSIQRYATPMEDEQFSTNDERMKHDKEIQEKPEVQMKCPECEKEEKTGAVQTKEGGGGTASPQLSSKIESSSGKGNTLPKKALSEMNRSFGTDFSNVKIHTDSESVEMSKELGAQAFTHGNDIYFNSGKYDADTAGGKQLLAHELTHVVQQGAAGDKKVQRQFDDFFEAFSPPKEEEETNTDTAAPAADSTGANPASGFPDFFGGLGDVIPMGGLPAWSNEFLDITIMSKDATCIGTASPSHIVPMSLCNASHFCTTPADFNFNIFYHYDADIIPRPQPFSDAAVSMGVDFIPDGQTIPTFSRHQSGTGIYNGPGAPLKTSFDSAFSFTTDKDGTLSVFAQMTDSATGIKVTYIDNIRCTIIPCT